ncbi:MAG: alkaline phosphatase family protein [Candidatus Micrarchaeaceae archaeon]
MLLKNLEPKIDDKEFQFLYPRYGGQSLVNVIPTINSALGVKTNRVPIKSEYYKDHMDFSGISKVVLVVLDGFGYRMWIDSDKDKGFFGKIAQKGIMMPITTVFPSTTAAAITTINTGLSPLEHGLPEWVLYFKEVKMIINTIPFTSYMSEKRSNLLDLKINPKILYDGRTVYENLSEEGVACHTITRKALINSAYNNVIKRGSNSHPYLYPEDAVIILRKLIESEKGHAYINLYIENIDSITHTYGPFSEESRAEISAISNTFKTQLLDKVDNKAAKETLVIVTADHGHTGIDPNTVIYTNDDKRLASFLATDRGNKILPTGSPRNFFLHINKKDTGNAYKYLNSKFEGAAKTIKSDDAIASGLFGVGTPHKKFRHRVGNLIILPKDHEAIWYEHVKDRKHHYLGYHGGLSKNEMLIPLGMARLSDLI